jgi:hypothetical protein
MPDQAEINTEGPSVAVIASVTIALALGAFVLIQAFLAAYNDHVLREAIDRGLIEIGPGGWEPPTILGRLFRSGIPGVIGFSALASRDR